ncbi:hypothetical protein [Neptunicella sp.]|uniref:hypothetical protein n=1 Tax=Neptunicella sp. TaxID=2125986 RepID=UPI003F69244C
MKKALSLSENVPKKFIGYYPAELSDPAILPLSQQHGLSKQNLSEQNNHRNLTICAENGLPRGTFGRLSICYWVSLFVKCETTLSTEQILNSTQAKSKSQLFLEVVGKRQSGSAQLESFWKSYYAATRMQLKVKNVFKPINNSNSLSTNWLTLKDQLTPVPVDIRALHLLHLQQSALGIDLYIFLTIKAFSLAKAGYSDKLFLLWATLEDVFINERSRCKNLYEFKKRIKSAMEKVINCFPGSHIEYKNADGLFIKRITPSVQILPSTNAQEKT